MKLIRDLYVLLNRKNENSIYLSIFRVYISIHIIKKILFYLPNLNLIYGLNSFVVAKSTDLYGVIDLNFFREHHYLSVYIILILAIMFLFGIGKNITCFALYISVEILQRMNEYPLNGGDNLLKFILLYLIFCDCYNFFCFNNKKKSTDFSNFLTNITCYSIVIHLCLIYFISAIHKIHSNVWFNGIATYYTLSLDRFSGTELNSYLVKNGLFVTFTTYATIIWELLFPFLVFNSYFKKTILISGVILHSSIYIFMMIHDFQILYISIYGLFLSDNDYLKFKNFIINKYEKVFNKYIS